MAGCSAKDPLEDHLNLMSSQTNRCIKEPMTNNLILIADTDPDALIALSKELRGADFDVVDAASGEEAIELCEDLSPALVLIDMELPNLVDSGLVSQLATRYRIPMIFLSEQSDLDVVQSAIGQGAFCYLVKPLDPRQVVPVIEAALRRSADLFSLKQKEKGLNENLLSNRQMNIAVGLLMERNGMSQREAHQALTNGARDQNKSVNGFASELILHANALCMPPQGAVAEVVAAVAVMPQTNHQPVDQNSNQNQNASQNANGNTQQLRNQDKPRDRKVRYLRRSMRTPKEK